MNTTPSPHSAADTDRRIRAMMRGEAPSVPDDPWFVRKTLNRLPERRQRPVSIPEAVAVALVVIGSVAIIWAQLHTLVTSSDPTSFNPTLLLAAAGTLLCLTLVKTLPVLRRCWN